MKKFLHAGLAGLLILTALGSSGCGKKEQSTEAFTPKLDTEEKVTLSTIGFFGNFEALDQVTNDFNQYYPNVEFGYEQVGGDNVEEYLDANPNVDIVMTSEEVMERYGENLEETFADLAEEKVDVSAIEEKLLSREKRGEKLYAIPMGQNLYGMIVNVSLLEKEGLSVPKNYEEFIDVLSALKEKGYTPIQGPQSKVYAELTCNMAFDKILEDENLRKDIQAGKESAVEALLPVYEKLEELRENGFIDSAVNEEYPEDNYDGAIMKFFEGDVPFWVCNTEKVSGMKKRESKSEAFQAEPFEYRYIYAPMGEKGSYAYSEPWFGFSVNKNAANYEYAVEFIRFLSTKEEINKIADIKRIPSVAVEKSDVEIYQDVLDPEQTEANCINEGEITAVMVSEWYTSINRYIAGDFASGTEALKYFVKACSEQ